MPWEWRYSAMTCLLLGYVFYYGNGYWLGDKGIPAQPEDMDAYETLENKIMEKYHLKEPFIWT